MICLHKNSQARAVCNFLIDIDHDLDHVARFHRSSLALSLTSPHLEGCLTVYVICFRAAQVKVRN
jgi:hypothetical protein